jgi:hypothetical protein
MLGCPHFNIIGEKNAPYIIKESSKLSHPDSCTIFLSKTRIDRDLKTNKAVNFFHQFDVFFNLHHCNE